MRCPMRFFVGEVWSVRKCLAVFAALIAAMVGVDADAAKPPIPVVRSDLEIEILDPGVDPEGNPAVVLGPSGQDGELSIDIPPAIIVHRYYYSGDRSFQGPPLPGGPSIIVATHPRTGQRCYLPTQLLPGAPIVFYRKDSILYDYGHHAIRVKFPRWGTPIVEYRSGTTWSTKVKQLLKIEQLKAGSANAIAATHQGLARRATMTRGMFEGMGGQFMALTRPAQRLVPYVPGGVPLSDPYFEEQMIRQIEQTKENRGLSRAAYEQTVREMDRPALP